MQAEGQTDSLPLAFARRTKEHAVRVASNRDAFGGLACQLALLTHFEVEAHVRLLRAEAPAEGLEF